MSLLRKWLKENGKTKISNKFFMENREEQTDTYLFQFLYKCSIESNTFLLS